MNTEQSDFWRSLLHEVYLLSLNDGGEYDYIPAEVKIGPDVYPYTACVRVGAPEPFKDALKNFPDYKKVATGSLKGFRYRS